MIRFFKKINSGIKKGIHYFYKLNNYVDDKGREFVRKRIWLAKLERKLDVTILGIYTVGVGLDYVATKMYCKNPSYEYNKFAQRLMGSCGIDVGLGLAVVSSYIGLLALAYGLYRASDWYLKRANLEFPVVRKLASYSVLGVTAAKHTYGALSWFI